MRKAAFSLGLSIVVLLMVLPLLVKPTDSLAMEPDYSVGAPPVFMPLIFNLILPLMNGDFESGPASWTPDLPNGATRPLIYEADDLPIAPYSGNWMAWFEREGIDGLYYLTQEITVPEEATHLSFWHWDDFGPNCGDAGVRVELCYTISFPSSCSPQWTYKLIDVGFSGCSGETQTLRIGMETYGGSPYPNAVFIDKLEFVDLSNK